MMHHTHKHTHTHTHKARVSASNMNNLLMHAFMCILNIAVSFMHQATRIRFLHNEANTQKLIAFEQLTWPTFGGHQNTKNMQCRKMCRLPSGAKGTSVVDQAVLTAAPRECHSHIMPAPGGRQRAKITTLQSIIHTHTHE